MKLELLLAICVGFALSGCAGRVQTVSSVANAGHPRRVDLYIAGMIQPRTHYIADGTFAAREEHPPQAHYDGRYDDRPVTRKRVAPTPARWAAFWRTVDRLDLAAWRPEYDQGDLPAARNGDHIYLTDGLSWKMRFSTAGGARISEGDGAFPAASRPSSTTAVVQPASRNGVLTLENAFAELLKL